MRKTIRLHFLLTALAFAALSLLAATADAAVGDIYETNQGMILRMNINGATPITFAIGLSNPKGIVFDGTGRIYVADASRGTIIRFNTPDGTGNTFASNLSSPVALTFDAAGTLYVGESGSGAISKFNVNDGTKTPFVVGAGEPAGFAFAANGNLFASDFAGNVIYQITPDGTKTTFANGLNFPAGLAFDSSGNLFVANSGNGIIYKFAPDGTRSNFVTGLSRPYGLVFEATGTLVVSDNGNGSTLRYAPDGTRTIVFSSDFNTPQFVAVEPTIHQLLNISTRGFIAGGDHILIAGFNVGGIGPVGTTVVIRALGPSLSGSGITDALADPVLEVHDASGALITFNNDWQDAMASEKVTVPGLEPGNAKEAALQLMLRGGAYTAIVYGFNGATGTALAEVYNVP